MTGAHSATCDGLTEDAVTSALKRARAALVLQGHILRLVTVGDWAADERCRSGHLCGEQIPVRCPSENARRQNQAAGGKYMIS